ncbi:hypothetical protein K2V61_07905 [Staphylococcus simulans]|uniref:hypothetical protein n=1 Tax=Staphylococcus simulans TaxID=1286 RepID=UPI001E35E469|nr:hypothetical protein [Staphylococcus simulans]MCD8915462.1 hypothetical protein [Staphylococcus simulans]
MLKKTQVPYKKERAMNGYVLILLIMLIIMGRLLDYALQGSLKQTFFSTSFMFHMFALVSYTTILIALKVKGEIRGLW